MLFVHPCNYVTNYIVTYITNIYIYIHRYTHIKLVTYICMYLYHPLVYPCNYVTNYRNCKRLSPWRSPVDKEVTLRDHSSRY